MTDAAAEAPHSPTFAAAFRDLLYSERLSQAGFGRRVGISQGNIARWLQGGRPELVNIWKIADYFGQDRDALARCAGYPAGTPTTALPADGLDPAMVALLEAERRRAHEELAGIPPVYWQAVIAAGKTARAEAAALARLAAQQTEAAEVAAVTRLLRQARENDAAAPPSERRASRRKLAKA